MRRRKIRGRLFRKGPRINRQANTGKEENEVEDWHAGTRRRRGRRTRTTNPRRPKEKLEDVENLECAEESENGGGKRKKRR
jgi:hypothetical protein